MYLSERCPITYCCLYLALKILERDWGVICGEESFVIHLYFRAIIHQESLSSSDMRRSSVTHVDAVVEVAVIAQLYIYLLVSENGKCARYRLIISFAVDNRRPKAKCTKFSAISPQHHRVYKSLRDAILARLGLAVK